MSQDEELARWSEDFRATSPTTSMPSLEELIAQARRDDRRRLLDWVLQVASLAFAALVFAWLVVWTRSSLVAVLSAVVLPVLFALSGFFVYLRVDESRVPAITVRDHVARAVRQRTIRARFARASLWALVILTTAFWMWLPFFMLSRWERFMNEPWRLAVAIVASLAIFGAGFAWTVRTRRKAREELERWTAVAAALAEE